MVNIGGIDEGATAADLNAEVDRLRTMPEGPPTQPTPPPIPLQPSDSQPLFSSTFTQGSAAGSYPQVDHDVDYPKIGPTAGPAGSTNPGTPASGGRPNRNVLIAAAGAVGVAVIAATALFLTQDQSTGDTTSTADGTAGTLSSVAVEQISACSTTPRIQPESVAAGSGGLTVSTRLTPSCSTGDLLTNNALRVSAVDSRGRDVAAGVFDLSTTPITIEPDSTSAVSFTFPPGSYWRLPEAISGELTLTATKDGRDISAAGRSGVSAVTAAGPSAPQSSSLEAAAQSALFDLADADREAIEGSLLNRWQPQLSSKRPGLFADGINWDYPAILKEHLDLRQRFPSARLVKSADWPVFSDPTWWVTVAGVPFNSGEDANGWCDAKGFDPDHCFAKILSHTMDTSGTTMLRH